MLVGEFGSPQVVHSPGFVQLCSNKSPTTSSKWAYVSCGRDFFISRWFFDPNSEECGELSQAIAERTSYAIAWNGENAYVGLTLLDKETQLERPVVSSMKISDLCFSPPLATFSLEVTTVDISKSSAYLAAGAQDHVVKVVKLATGDFDRIELEGQILCVCFDPLDKLLAVTSSDGLLSVFSIPIPENTTPSFTNRFCPPISDVDVTCSRMQVCWSPDGEILFAPAVGCVKKLSRASFKDSSSFSVPDANIGQFSVCCISKDGNYLAATNLAGKICVWNVKSGSLLTMSSYCRDGEPKTISSLLWHPSIDDTLVFHDTEEYLCTLSGCTKEVVDDDNGTEKVAVDSQEDDDEFSRTSIDLGAIKKAYGFDEDGVHISEKSPPLGKVVHTETPIITHPPYRPPCVPKCFSSASTPEHLSERFLKWNQFGVISLFSSGDENSVEIRWHDAAVHSEMNIDNSSANYFVADITNEMVALGAKADGDQPSKLVVHCIGASNFVSREWTVKFSAGENVELIAVATSFVATASSSRFIRIFSPAGTQKLIFSYSGSLLTMSAWGNLLAIALLDGGYFFESESEKPQFNVTVKVFRIDPFGWFKSDLLVNEIPLAISREADLEWMGFSKNGALCTMDSECCVRMLTANNIWLPIHNFSSSLKSKSDHAWLISIVERPKAEIRYVLCKGSQYPLLTTRVVPLVVDFHIPLCDYETDKSQTEERLLLCETQMCSSECGGAQKPAHEFRELTSEHAKNIMRLFVLACKAERDSRAVEFASNSSSQQLIQTLSNYAAKTRRTVLADKISKIGKKLVEDVDSEYAAREMEDQLLVPRKPTISLNTSSWKGSSSKENLDTDGVDNGPEETDGHFNESMDSEPSFFPHPPKIPIASNPFKRKASDVDQSDQKSGKVFELLSAPAPRSLQTVEVNQSKKLKKTEVSRQSILSFSSTKEEGGSRTSGFELWMKSEECDIANQFDGPREQLLALAAKRFRALPIEQKEKWNRLASS